MLQEVHKESLAAVLADRWTRDNFVVSNVEAPGRYFTLMMVSQGLRTAHWFRMPLPTQMERDALVVDLAISSTVDCKRPDRFLRLCTTHLESLVEAECNELRPLQLARISAVLRAPPTHDTEVVGGLVGGDMNSISRLDATSHKAEDVELYDVWEEAAKPPIPPRTLFRRDLTDGRARGNTWGYQSANGKRSDKWLDEFFHTESVCAVSLNQVQDLTGTVGRIGVGLKTRVEVLEFEHRVYISRGSRIIKQSRKSHFDPWTQFPRLQADTGLCKEIDVWLSDHFGIAVGIVIG